MAIVDTLNAREFLGVLYRSFRGFFTGQEVLPPKEGSGPAENLEGKLSRRSLIKHAGQSYVGIQLAALINFIPPIPPEILKDLPGPNERSSRYGLSTLVQKKSDVEFIPSAYLYQKLQKNQLLILGEGDSSGAETKKFLTRSFSDLKLDHLLLDLPREKYQKVFDRLNKYTEKSPYDIVSGFVTVMDGVEGISDDLNRLIIAAYIRGIKIKCIGTTNDKKRGKIMAEYTAKILKRGGKALALTNFSQALESQGTGSMASELRSRHNIDPFTILLNAQDCTFYQGREYFTDKCIFSYSLDIPSLRWDIISSIEVKAGNAPTVPLIQAVDGYINVAKPLVNIEY